MNLNIGFSRYTTDKLGAFLRSNGAEEEGTLFRAIGRGDVELRPDESFLVIAAEQDGDIAGVSVCIMEGAKKGGGIRASTTVVTEEWQRKGLGWQVLKSKIAVLESLGRTVKFAVRPEDHNAPVVKLLTKVGFAQFGYGNNSERLYSRTKGV